MSLLAIQSLDDFIYAKAPKSLNVGNGVFVGAGTLIPEIKFTLPPITIEESTMPQIRDIYKEIINGVLKRALELQVPGLIVEFETLPPMTVNPDWGVDITRILSDAIQTYLNRGLKAALRLTINDTREHERPPLLRRGKYWDGMVKFMDRAKSAGANLVSIESTGGKELCDEALTMGDLRTLVFALGILAARDMEFLWKHIVSVCKRDGMVPAGDSACGFGNTAMVLADQGFIPKVFAAITRVATVPRSLVAVEMGATGPAKDCAYENPYLKAITGIPISMEGRTAACAHLSHVGNISQAVCDAWSNESVQHVRLLSAYAPVVSMEQLAYDCRLLNAASKTAVGARQMRDWLAASDAPLDVQAHVLRPDVVLKLASVIMEEPTPFLRTRRAALEAIREIKRATAAGEVAVPKRELKYLDKYQAEVEAIPEDEGKFVSEMKSTPLMEKCIFSEYGLK